MSVVGFDHGQALPLAGYRLEEAEARRVDALGQPGPFVHGARQFALHPGALSFELGALALDGRALFPDRAFGRVDAGVELVGLKHVLQNDVFEPGHVRLGGGDLVLHGRVLLVGLDGHELVLEAGQPGLNLGEALLDLPPLFPRLVPPLPDVLHSAPAGLEPFVEGG